MWFVESVLPTSRWYSLIPIEPIEHDVYSLMRRQLELNALELDIPLFFPTEDMLAAEINILKSDRIDVMHCVHKKERFGSVCFQVDTTWGDDVIYTSYLLYEVLAVRRAVACMYGVWSPRCGSKLRYKGVVYDNVRTAAKELKIPVGSFTREISNYRNLKQAWPKESGDVLSH